jgi:hypothetical protein
LEGWFESWLAFLILEKPFYFDKIAQYVVFREKFRMESGLTYRRAMGLVSLGT